MKTKTTETPNAGVRVRTLLRGGASNNADVFMQTFFVNYPQCNKPAPHSETALRCNTLLSNFMYACADRCNFDASCTQSCDAGAAAVRAHWAK